MPSGPTVETVGHPGEAQSDKNPSRDCEGADNGDRVKKCPKRTRLFGPPMRRAVNNLKPLGPTVETVGHPGEAQSDKNPSRDCEGADNGDPCQKVGSQQLWATDAPRRQQLDAVLTHR
jgi:hypothetical protein